VLLFPLLFWMMLGVLVLRPRVGHFQRHPAPPATCGPGSWAGSCCWPATWRSACSGVKLQDIAGRVRLLEHRLDGAAGVAAAAVLPHPRGRVELSRFIMLAGLVRALFGLVRWAVFGATRTMCTPT
jgi:hypothetical protein